MYILPEKRKKNFGKTTNFNYIPDLIDVQRSSYDVFLQRYKDSLERENKGLESAFREIFPIESPNDDLVLEYGYYVLGDSKHFIQECKKIGSSYSVILKANLRLIIKETGEIREQSVYIGEIPIMTEMGTFIINGISRVVVNQLHRSPGIFFSYDSEKSIHNAKIIPYRGSWLEFEIDNKGILIAKIDKKKKFPASLLIKSLSDKYNTNENILRKFYSSVKTRIKKDDPKQIRKILNKRVIKDIINKETGEILLEAGSKINEDNISTLQEMEISEVELIEFPNEKDSSILVNTLEKDNVENQEQAIIQLLKFIKPNETYSFEKANLELHRLFFNPKTFDLGEVGRYKINRKFVFNNPEDFKDVQDRTLRSEDIIETVRYLINLIEEVDDYHPDDIDHLGNRRVRTAGELVLNQVKVGLSRIERVAKERMSSHQDIESQTPQLLISAKPMTAVINEFFGSSQLSQFMDETNPLSELTHKRRLNALGPGGLSKERAGFEVRDVHYSHYGRVCPIETPEGQNIGLILSLASYSKINSYGFIETPYYTIEKGKISTNIEFLPAYKEDYHHVAQSIPSDSNSNIVQTRYRSDFPLRPIEKTHYMDVAPTQVVSISTSLIPFLGHDDANRALMGSNMQRQALPLISPEIPLVGTGIENKVAYDSRVCILSKNDGYVTKVDSKSIHIKDENTDDIVIYETVKFRKTNQNTCFNQRPVVQVLHSDVAGFVKKIDNSEIGIEDNAGNISQYSLQYGSKEFIPLIKIGDKIEKGEPIAGQKVYSQKTTEKDHTIRKATLLTDGPAVDQGELALGKNILVGFMPWEGYNFEDAILISERVVKDDVFTSIHIEEYEIQAKEIKTGSEVITSDIPNISDKAFRDLNSDGVIRIGAKVKPGDILVGMMTPKSEGESTPEFKLLHAIFGEKSREVKDSSLRLPNGFEGTVINTQRLSKKNGDELPPGVEESVKVYVAKKRKLMVGDKMAGRHGNKGVVSRIMPMEDMPYMEDGTPLDIVLNPLGVPSRMNLGQVFETQLGFIGKKLGLHFEVPVFDDAKDKDIFEYSEKAKLPSSSKIKLIDGRTGEYFINEVFCGYVYILKLSHLVDDKMHSRSIGPYSLVTQQPLGGKAQTGGQRLGEMEVWALESYGASYTLQEFLTLKSDDMLGRSRIYEAIIKGIQTIKPDLPESFNVLVQELRGLALDIVMKDKAGKNLDISSYESIERQKRTSKKIEFGILENA